MTVFTAGELAGMRAIADDFLPGTAVVQSQAYVSDGGGGGTTAWTASGTLSCRLAPLATGTGEEVTGNRISPDADSIVTLPFDADVDENDRLVISGKTYNAVTVRARSWNLTTRVEVKRQS